MISIDAGPGPPFLLLVSTEGKKDQLFYDTLIETWQEKRSAAAPAAEATASLDEGFDVPTIPASDQSRRVRPRLT